MNLDEIDVEVADQVLKTQAEIRKMLGLLLPHPYECHDVKCRICAARWDLSETHTSLTVLKRFLKRAHRSDIDHGETA